MRASPATREEERYPRIQPPFPVVVAANASTLLGVRLLDELLDWIALGRSFRGRTAHGQFN